MNKAKAEYIQEKVRLLSKDKVPVIAVCERVIQTRVSYVRADAIKEALNEWSHGGEFDYDYLPDEHQLESKVDVVTANNIIQLDAYHYDDEMPISKRDKAIVDLEFD